MALETRAFEALDAMGRLWNGEFLVFSPGLTELAERPRTGYLRPPSDLPFRVVEVRPDLADLRDHPLDLVTGLLVPTSAPILDIGAPAILTTELTYRTRLDIHRAEAPARVLPRMALGLARTELRFRSMVRRAAGVECNGPAATRTYARLARRSMSYRDHRLHRADVAAAARVPAWDGKRPLHVGFSGRHEAVKGPQFVVEVARRAYHTGLPVTFSIFGRGPLEQELRAAAPPTVRFRGFRDFRTEWVADVQNEIDVMMLPHLQGDPSCTYSESLGSGAPVLGFHNETLTPLVKEHGVGWAVRRGDTDALYDRLTHLLKHPDEVDAARKAGLALVGSEPFEDLMERRAAFFRSVALEEESA
ncbi:glycosyltransferase [Micrococcus luteus]|uniref:glycosyltransferase n=1 Tax=Micrococcus sp. SL257 TaxID=2995171 RepID=UPI00226E8498|nr:glycosyltransferase [Micrococcus sp. SL257]MCV7470684.1 glycosyltransferase [Micrococcus luteus]MCV7486511.1 glycosyltransferase [Micrococcus luteus]MCV7598523.1 glycosyltransferase [Micrococcus luteus]WAC16400.1 glycosyltransferase [Micrococcus sp. SL257]